MKPIILAALAAPLLLSGCVAGAVAGAAVGATGAVIGGGVDLVTESREERLKKENNALKKENERLRKAQKNR